MSGGYIVFIVFSYPISPIATTDLNMLTLFCGGCINKFVVMQARYSPLCSFHLLHLDPRRFCPLHTLVNEDTSQMVRNLIYIPDQGSYISNQGSGLKKLGILFSPNSTRLDHQARFFLSKPSPICDQAWVKPNFHVQFSGRASFFWTLGKKIRPLSNLLFIADRKFLSKPGQHISWNDILRTGKVHHVGQPINRYIHVKY